MEVMHTSRVHHMFQARKEIQSFVIDGGFLLGRFIPNQGERQATKAYRMEVSTNVRSRMLPSFHHA